MTSTDPACHQLSISTLFQIDRTTFRLDRITSLVLGQRSCFFTYLSAGFNRFDQATHALYAQPYNDNSSKPSLLLEGVLAIAEWEEGFIIGIDVRFQFFALKCDSLEAFDIDVPHEYCEKVNRCQPDRQASLPVELCVDKSTGLIVVQTDSLIHLLHQVQNHPRLAEESSAIDTIHSFFLPCDTTLSSPFTQRVVFLNTFSFSGSPASDLLLLSLFQLSVCLTPERG